MKTLTAFVCAALLSLGLVSTAAPANAAPYPKSVGTACSTTITKPVIKPSTRPRVAFSAAPTAGNGAPSGTATITFSKGGVVKRTVTRPYTGGTAVYVFKRLRKGSWTINVSLATAATSVFKNCADDTALTVRRRA